jgi:hypothetical protein
MEIEEWRMEKETRKKKEERKKESNAGGRCGDRAVGRWGVQLHGEGCTVDDGRRYAAH